MRARLVVGNWKMHGSLPDNEKLLDAVMQGATGLRACAAAVCVPFPYLYQTQQRLTGSKVAWGSQNASEHAKGAFTGEVSAPMVREFGARYVIVGHSERRALYAESDAVVAAKFRAVQAAGMQPILCVGETLAEREAGSTEDVVGRQLRAVAESAGADGLRNSVLAYEPVWAIGTGRTATPEQAQAVHAFLRKLLGGYLGAGASEVSMLYGGSVKPSNAAELFAQPDIDGGLIGGASLVAEDFLAICRAADA